MDKVILDPPLQTLEQSLLHIDDLLRSAAATAYACADDLVGEPRDLAFSTRHLIDMARTEVDRSLRRLEVH